jgi:hypothetical protein
MTIKSNYVATLLAAGATAVAIVAAPTASAAPGAVQVACSSATPGSSCLSPGNAQINDSLPPNFLSQEPFYDGYGRHGGGHR